MFFGSCESIMLAVITLPLLKGASFKCCFVLFCVSHYKDLNVFLSFSLILLIFAVHAVESK